MRWVLVVSAFCVTFLSGSGRIQETQANPPGLPVVGVALFVAQNCSTIACLTGFNLGCGTTEKNPKAPQKGSSGKFLTPSGK